MGSGLTPAIESDEMMGKYQSLDFDTCSGISKFQFNEEDRPLYQCGVNLYEVVPGAGSLVEHLDKRIFVWLRDGRMYMGMLRSVDHFANLVLEKAHERIQIGDNYGDLRQGVIVIRGENVALLGEDDSDLKQLPEALFEAHVTKDQKKEKMDKLKVGAFWRRGMIFIPEDYF